MGITVTELKNILEGLEDKGLGGEVVKIAYQPYMPIECLVGHVYAEQIDDCGGKEVKGVYLCEDLHVASKYASKCIFEDDVNFIR